MSAALRTVLACAAGGCASGGTVMLRRVKSSLGQPGVTGFQAVTINLCVDSEVTRVLGLENHVCELQLVPQSVHNVQVSLGEESHQRYQAYRDRVGLTLQTLCPTRSPLFRSPPVDHHSLVAAGEAAAAAAASRASARNTMESMGMRIAGAPQQPFLDGSPAAAAASGVNPRRLLSALALADDAGASGWKAQSRPLIGGGVSVRVGIGGGGGCPSGMFSRATSDGCGGESWSAELCQAPLPIGGGNVHGVGGRSGVSNGGCGVVGGSCGGGFSGGMFCRTTSDGIGGGGWAEPRPQPGSIGGGSFCCTGRGGRCGGLSAAEAGGIPTGLKLAMLGLLRKSTLGEAWGAADRRCRDVAEGVRLASASSVWFTSRPTSSSLTRPYVQLLFTLVSIFFLFQAQLGLNARGAGYFPADIVRFRPLCLRDPPRPPAQFKLSSIHLLHDGQPVPATSISRRDDAIEIIPTPPSPGSAPARHFNGIVWETAAGDPGADPLCWTIEASADGGRSWDPVGASVWRFTYGGKGFFYPHLPHEVPASPRGAAVRVEYRRSWAWLVPTVVGNFITALGMLSTVLGGLTGRVNLPFMVMVLVPASRAACNLWGGWAFYCEGQMRDMIERLAFVPETSVLSLGMAWDESKILWWLLAFGVLGVMNKFLFVTSCFEPDPRFFAVDTSLGIHYFTIVFAIVMSVYRWWVLSTAQRLTLIDKGRYDRVWAKVLADDFERQWLEEINRQVGEMSRFLAGEVRQTTRIWEFGGSVGLLGGPMCGTMHVRSLDQLFAQACCLHPVLVEKVKVWATMCMGCPPLPKYPRFFKPYTDLTEDEKASIKWGKVKSVSRAVEKVVRSYSQDSSRLLDVCRQTIVFQHAADMAACFRLIALDPDVQVLRIKNRMEPGSDASESGGYRDLAMNLRLVSAVSQQLGLDYHVCELQLLLLPFAEIKSDEGHRRYVELRNMRGN